MSTILERALAALDLLSRHPDGLAVAQVAQALNLAPSAAHRLLTDLVRLGYARQVRAQGDYALTLRLAVLGLGWMGRAGLPDLVQPVLDDLAVAGGELVRLSVVDGGRLVWVAVAQGATHGLRYDPAREQGADVSLAHSASGRAWLMTLPEDQALQAAARQGLALPPDAAPGPVPTLADVARERVQALGRGYAVAVDTFLAGMAALAVPVRGADGAALGCLSIAGPAVRMGPDRMAALAPVLQAAARAVGEAAAGSALFRGARA